MKLLLYSGVSTRAEESPPRARLGCPSDSAVTHSGEWPPPLPCPASDALNRICFSFHFSDDDGVVAVCPLKLRWAQLIKFGLQLLIMPLAKFTKIFCLTPQKF